jgi:hypothetical protein
MADIFDFMESVLSADFPAVRRYIATATIEDFIIPGKENLPATVWLMQRKCTTADINIRNVVKLMMDREDVRLKWGEDVLLLAVLSDEDVLLDDLVSRLQVDVHDLQLRTKNFPDLHRGGLTINLMEAIIWADAGQCMRIMHMHVTPNDIVLILRTSAWQCLMAVANSDRVAYWENHAEPHFVLRTLLGKDPWLYVNEHCRDTRPSLCHRRRYSEFRNMYRIAMDDTRTFAVENLMAELVERSIFPEEETFSMLPKFVADFVADLMVRRVSGELYDEEDRGRRFLQKFKEDKARFCKGCKDILCLDCIPTLTTSGVWDLSDPDDETSVQMSELEQFRRVQEELRALKSLVDYRRSLGRERMRQLQQLCQREYLDPEVVIVHDETGGSGGSGGSGDSGDSGLRSKRLEAKPEPKAEAPVKGPKLVRAYQKPAKVVVDEQRKAGKEGEAGKAGKGREMKKASEAREAMEEMTETTRTEETKKPEKTKETEKEREKIVAINLEVQRLKAKFMEKLQSSK